MEIVLEFSLFILTGIVVFGGLAICGIIVATRVNGETETKPSVKFSLHSCNKPRQSARIYKRPDILIIDDLDVCYIKCESCQKDTDMDTMNVDNDCNYFCPECWAVLAPVMKAEYDEMVRNGEIEPD